MSAATLLRVNPFPSSQARFRPSRTVDQGGQSRNTSTPRDGHAGPGRFEPPRRRHRGTFANHDPDSFLLMSEPTPATPPTEEAKKRLREKVDKLLAQGPFKSEGSIVLNGRTMKYSAVAAFVPVTAGGLDE